MDVDENLYEKMRIEAREWGESLDKSWYCSCDCKTTAGMVQGRPCIFFNCDLENDSLLNKSKYPGCKRHASTIRKGLIPLSKRRKRPDIKVTTSEW